MRIKRYWKKIAVLVMTTAFLLQGQAVLAAETETVTETVEVKETKAAPQTEAPKQSEAPQTEAPKQTEAPQTEAPQTEAPQTEAHQTEAPQTEAHHTEAPQTEAPQTEAPQTEAPQTEALQTEAPQTEAVETEAIQTEAEETEAIQTEAVETETESEEESETESEKEESYKTDFRFENGEIIIVAKATKDAKLPENTEMQVKKLEVGSAKYEEAKRATEAKMNASEDAEYIFYDVTFVSDGKELDPAEGTVVIQVEFKTVQVDADAQQQSVLQIEDTGSGKVAKDVTAAAAEGTNMSSVKFSF